MKKLLILAYCAIVVPLWAINQHYHVINIPAAAEDDCAYYYGAYALDEVVHDDLTGGVICKYR
jgi:hypothetical protein